MRLQDVWGDLPEFEQDIIGKDVLFKIQEYRKGQAALKLLPLNLRKFYDVHFGSGIGNDEGEFIGLACHTCGKWLGFGHNQDCPVNEIMPSNFDYHAIDEGIRRIAIGANE